VTLKLSNVAAIAAVAGLVTAMGASPLLRIYNGTVPTDADTALSGNTLLAELAMSATPFPAAIDGNPNAIATANAISSDTSADATGTATFFRIYKADGTTCVLQGAVGTSGQQLNLNSTSIVANETVSVSSLTLTMPE